MVTAFEALGRGGRSLALGRDELSQEWVNGRPSRGQPPPAMPVGEGEAHPTLWASPSPSLHGALPEAREGRGGHTPILAPPQPSQAPRGHCKGSVGGSRPSQEPPSALGSTPGAVRRDQTSPLPDSPPPSHFSVRFLPPSCGSP